VRDNVIQNVPTAIHQNVGGSVGQVPAPAYNNTLLNNGGASPSTIDNAGLEPEYADITSLASVSAPAAVLLGSGEY
jgi:hypothetical protein